MSPEIWALLIGAILGSTVLGSIVTALFMRRTRTAEINKMKAETASEEFDTDKKVSDVLKEMRSENVDLYKKNIELEKTNTDQIRTIEILTARLESRDSQLASATKQLDLLRSLAEQTPITETLRSQLEAVNQVVLNLQAAQSEGQKIMFEKDKAIQELFRTNRDLEFKKPAR